MKNIFLFTLLLCSKFALADLPKIKIESKKMDISASEIILVRTSATPDKIRLMLTIPTYSEQCVETGTRMVWGQSSYHCGTEDRIAQKCETVCRPERPPGSPGQDPNKPVKQICENVCRPVTVTHVRSCYYPEQFCARYGTVTTMIEDQVTIKFKDGGLGGSETEEYVLSGKQKNFGLQNILFELKASKTIGDVKIDVDDILLIGDIITVKKR